jgi:membrane peptidoglycan carboxypeptidase
MTQPEAAKARQRVVLDLMVQAGYVDAAAADRAYREDLAYAGEPFAIEAPHFCMLVRQQLAEAVGEETLRAGGLRIYTTLDLNLQRAAEGQVRRHLATLAESEPGEPAHNVHNAAVVALDPRSGAVRVLVGSPDYFDAAIDGAVNAAVAPRQSGSAIKPLTYAAAFERGYSPASMVVDVSTTFTTREGRPYTPVNYDYREHGPVLLRQALGSSYNIVAVKLLDRIGIAALVDLAGRLGLPELGREDCQGLAMTLGSCEVPLTRLTAAYAALANGGDRVTPQYIERVETADGEVLWSATPTRTPVLDSRVAYLITDILADDDARAPTFGRNSVLRLPFAAAVKTGTTTDWRDNWTVGYTSEIVVGVWVGNADNAPMEQVSGVTGAAPIWRGVMLAAQQTPPAAGARPDGLREVEVCAESGCCPARPASIAAPSCSWPRTCRPRPVPCTLGSLLTPAPGRWPRTIRRPSARWTRRVTYWPAEACSGPGARGWPAADRGRPGRGRYRGSGGGERRCRGGGTVDGQPVRPMAATPWMQRCPPHLSGWRWRQWPRWTCSGWSCGSREPGPAVDGTSLSVLLASGGRRARICAAGRRRHGPGTGQRPALDQCAC